MNLNLLNKCKVYLAGSMEFSNGQPWRDYLEEKLADINLQIFNPYRQGFIREFSETEDARRHLMELRAAGNFEELERLCKQIRIYDLSYVDRSDFLIAYWNNKICSLGTSEEITWANRLKKPIFTVIEQGKNSAPLWMFGMYSNNYMYNSFDEVIDYIRKIDSGEIKISDLTDGRMKLLIPEYR